MLGGRERSPAPSRRESQPDPHPSLRLFVLTPLRRARSCPRRTAGFLQQTRSPRLFRKPLRSAPSIPPSTCATATPLPSSSRDRLNRLSLVRCCHPATRLTPARLSRTLSRARRLLLPAHRAPALTCSAAETDRSLARRCVRSYAAPLQVSHDLLLTLVLVPGQKRLDVSSPRATLTPRADSQTSVQSTGANMPLTPRDAQRDFSKEAIFCQKASPAISLRSLPCL